MGVRVEIHLDEAKLNAVVEPVERRKLASIQRRGANAARLAVPVRTGNLGRTIGELPIKLIAPRVVTGGVEATARYAAPVHEGSRPHIIRARNAQALRFVAGGRVVFAKFVNHPGTKARPFLRLAMERVAIQEVAG